MENEEHLGAKIKAIRMFLGMAQGDFADSLEMKQGSYADIERGRNSLSSRTLNILAKKHNINLNYIFNDSEDMFLTKSENSESTIKGVVKIYDMSGIVGKGKAIQEYQIPNLEGEHIGILVKGSAMLPTIGDGDIAIIQWLQDKERVQHNHPYVIIKDGVLLIKRILIGSHKITLRSDNAFYDDITIDKNDIQKIGAIVFVIRKGENI